MSTEWLPSKPIPFSKIKGIKTEKVWEHIVPPDENGHYGTTEHSACLTDGKNYLWAFENGGATWFTRYGGNDVGEILEALSEQFDVVWASEYDPGFNRLANAYSHITFSLVGDDLQASHYTPDKAPV